MESSPSLASSLPSRRARAHGGGGNQVVSCLVDGCNSDLSRCRDYHRRHKVCEQHSKTPRVMIGGMEQRFCQQCSRFHSLGEFDEGKRSCRKRLEGHNRRRRKPQPESLSVNPANFLSAAPGGRFLPYSASSMIPATSAMSSVNWPAVKTEADPSSLIYSGGRSEFNVLSGPPQQQRSLPPSSYAAAAFTRARQFPFLQDSPPHLSASSTHQPFHASGNGGSCSNPKNFFSGTPAPASSPNGLNHVMNTDRALSLLSSSPSSETPEIGLGSLMQQQQSPNHARPSITDLHYSSMGQYHHHHHHPGPHGLDVHGSHAGGGGGALISNFFQSAGSDGPSSSGPHQTISFSWG